MKCRFASLGYLNNMDAEGWPDYVEIENDGNIVKGTYDTRDYYPVDIDALLALADEIETRGVDCYTVSAQYVLDEYAQRIREACGVSE